MPNADRIQDHSFDRRRSNVIVTPMMTDSVGHGTRPSGAATARDVHDCASTKCGYTQPNTTSTAPSATLDHFAIRTRSAGRRQATAASDIERTANVVPLNGLPEAQAKALTDSNGDSRRNPARRFDGRHLMITAAQNNARAPCHPMATNLH